MERTPGFSPCGCKSRGGWGRPTALRTIGHYSIERATISSNFNYVLGTTFCRMRSLLGQDMVRAGTLWRVTDKPGEKSNNVVRTK